MSDGQVIFEIGADGSKAISAVRQVTSEIEKEAKKWDDSADNASDNIQKSLERAFDVNRVKDYALKIGAEIVKFGAEAVNLASDLQEVQNVVDVTFGASSGVIDAWASNAMRQFGLTETQAKRFASTIGALAKSAGVSSTEIVDMSTNLAGLAADMASFYNMDFETAFQKIRSGISGETEPLKALGVNMSVANLEAYALSQGISKAFSKMTQGEQVMLRYQYLLSATADAQGDFARTSDGYANSLRLLQNNLDQLKTKIGSALIEPVQTAIGNINTLFEKLMPEEKPETVFDQINAVKIETAEKIEQINATADAARALVTELQKIEDTNITPATKKINDGLASINVDQSKIGILQDFVKLVSENIEQVGSLGGSVATLNTATSEGAESLKTWLGDVAEGAKTLTEDDAKGWALLASSLSEGLPGLAETDGGKEVLRALGGEIAGEAGAASRYLEALGVDTSEVANRQSYWLALCRELVRTIPGLSEIINTQTGEVEGGTKALSDYIDQWEKTQEKAALLQELQKERQILEERYAERHTLKVDTTVAQANLQRVQKQWESFEEEVRDSAVSKSVEQRTGISLFSPLTEQEKEFLKVNQELIDAKSEYDRALAAEEEYMDSYNDALKVMQQREEAVADAYGDIEEAQDSAAASASKWSEETQEAIKNAIPSAQTAVTELMDYVEGVRTSVEKSVDSVISGFARIEMPSTKANQKYQELIEKQQKLGKRTKQNAKEWDKLDAKIKEAYSTLGNKPENLQAALSEQSAFMTKYIENLKQAREFGVSDELLASLADGSAESAEYLEAIVSDKTGETARAIDAQWKEVQELRKEFTNTLTNQQLAADKVFEDLAGKAAEAISSLDQSQSAAEKTGKTMQAIISTINDNVDGVSGAVTSIMTELNRLNGWGVNISFGGLGQYSINFSNFQLDGSFATGLDFVPFNGFLAELHEGEGILTAEENRIWQRFKNGGDASRNVDYETLGGVMRDNVHAGGNVYLDGRVVGGVISDMQAKNYRALKRSGWQA